VAEASWRERFGFRRWAVIAAALLGVVLLGSSTAEAKPTIYPVTITVKVKSAVARPRLRPQYAGYRPLRPGRVTETRV